MKHDAILKGKTIRLTDKEKAAGEAFHKKRHPFAWVNNQLVFNHNPDDDRDHQHWLLEDFGVSPDEWENMNRGYMLPDRIQLFIGSYFAPIDTKTITENDITELLLVHAFRYNSHDEPPIYNGVHIGKIGEIWKPMLKISNTSDGIKSEELSK